jgi:hypothetical protein
VTSKTPVYILPSGERLYDMNMFEYNLNALDSDRSNNQRKIILDSALKEKSPISPIRYINDLVVKP